MKLIKKIKKRIKKMENSRKDKLESDFLILMLLAAAAVAVFAIMVDTKKPQAVPRQPTVKEMTKEEKVAIQEKVAGFVASANLDGCEEVRGVFIDGIDYYKVCVNNAAKKIALEKLDLSYCDKLDGELMSIYECKQEVAQKLPSQDGISGLCQYFQGDERIECEDRYWLGQARLNLNREPCNNIKDTKRQNACKDIVLLKQYEKDEFKVSCMDFSKESLREDCQVLKKIKNEKEDAKCMQLKERRFQDICLSLLSITE